MVCDGRWCDECWHAFDGDGCYGEHGGCDATVCGACAEASKRKFFQCYDCQRCSCTVCGPELRWAVCRFCGHECCAECDPGMRPIVDTLVDGLQVRALQESRARKRRVLPHLRGDRVHLRRRGLARGRSKSVVPVARRRTRHVLRRYDRLRFETRDARRAAFVRRPRGELRARLNTTPTHRLPRDASLYAHYNYVPAFASLLRVLHPPPSPLLARALVRSSGLDDDVSPVRVVPH